MLKHLLLCSTLLSACAMTSVAATENWTVGSNTWEVEQTTEDLCPGVKYHLVNWKTNRSSAYPGSRLHVIEVDLTNPKISIENVKNPSSMYGTRTLINHAKAIHSSTHQAIAGVNANFWNNTSSNNFAGAYGGQGAHGVCISDGVMFTDPNIASVAHVGGPITTTGMFAVDNDGKVYLDFLKEQVLRNFGTDDNPIWATENGEGSGSEFSCFNKSIGHQMQLDMCNRFVPWSCASCFTKEWGDRAFNVGDLTDKFTTNVGTPGTNNVIGAGEYYTEVLLDFDEGTTDFNIGGKTPMVIKEIRAYGPGEQATIGKLDGHDLAVVGRGGFGNVMNAAWRVGHKVNFNTTVNFVDHGTPNGIKEAVSGNIMAMKNGEICPYTTSTAAPYGQGGYDNTYYPRTLLGVNADRTKFYMLVCEHNVKNPTRYFGFTTEQMCIMARDHFGVSNATQMDCGGSTYMYAKGGNVARSYDNAQGERAVYNGVFVCYNGDDVKLPEPGTYEEEEPEIEDPDKGWVDSGERAHFAYGLSTASDSRGVPTANYFLTGDVKAVDVILTNADDDTDVVTIAGGTAKGLNTVYVDDPALNPGTNYKWAVKVYSNPVTATSHFLHDAPGKICNNANTPTRGGVGVVTDPESPAYGNVVYSMGFAQGFGMYNADGTKAGNWHAGMAPWTASNRSDLYRIGMRNKNTAYACCFSDKGAGYWKFDPTSPETTPENLSGGTNDGTGCFKMPNGTVVGSGAPGIAFQRKSDTEEYFWVFAEDWPSGNSDFKGILCKWKTDFEDKIEHGLMGADGSHAGTGIFGYQNICITPTPGGVFCAQVRNLGQNTTGCPAFVYITDGFAMPYNSGYHQELFTSCGGSVAISDDLSLFAISGNNENIKVFDVTWDGDTPTFKFRTVVNDTKHVTETSQLAFDPAGNLYAWQASSDANYSGLFGYSWKNDAPEALTPAKANDLILAQRFTGIDNIVTDAENATPVYYTVQGVRVDNANLVPGLYIKVTGRKAEKVVIK